MSRRNSVIISHTTSRRVGAKNRVNTPRVRVMPNTWDTSNTTHLISRSYDTYLLIVSLIHMFAVLIYILMCVAMNIAMYVYVWCVRV